MISQRDISAKASFSLRQLRYFVATAETLSITVAAARLHISQPSISTAITELEQLFGLPLFIRHHARGMSLTPAGHQLTKEARSLLRHAEEVLEAAGELSESVAGRIAVGCLVTVAPMLLPTIAIGFPKAFPRVIVVPTAADQARLLEQLNQGILDCAITYDFAIPDEFGFLELIRLPPCALLPDKHPLAKCSTVTLADLSEEPMVLLDLPLSREYFQDLFENDGRKPRVVFRSEHGDLVRAMVASGFGYTLWNFPLHSNQASNGQQFRVRPIVGDLMRARLGIVFVRSSHPRKIVEAFKGFCESELPTRAAWPDFDNSPFH